MLQEPTTPAAEPTPEPDPKVLAEMLSQRHKNGANWFFWIAGLSVINSVLAVTGTSIRFIFGLGVTQVVDAAGQALAEDVGGADTLSFVVSLIGAGVAALFGVFARKRIHPLYALGMFLYLADGALMLLFQDWLGAGFHLWALFGLWSGLAASRKLRQLELERGPELAMQGPSIDLEDNTPIG